MNHSKLTRKIKPSRNRTRSQRRVKLDLEQLTTFYQGLDGFQVNRERVAVPGTYDTVYGEVTLEGMKVMQSIFNELAPLSSLPLDRRVFCDLGCGNGKAVIGLAILNPGLKTRGYEILVERVEQAKTALSRIKHRDVVNRCSFESTSFLEPSVSLKQASWIYVSNLCMNGETQDALAKKLEAECPPRCIVICSKNFPFAEGSRFSQVRRQVVPMTWSANSEIVVYQSS